MPPLRIGYVGLDHPHRPGYLELLDGLPAEVVAACEPDESFDLGGFDLPTYRDPGELFDAEPVDAAWVTLSNHGTPAVVEAALERGLDVFSEKPMARTAADLVPVVDVARGSDATVAVAYGNRAHPAAIEIRERARAGFFGDVRTVEARLMATTLAERLEHDLGAYVYDAAASRGGVLQWLGCHWLDLIEWALEDPIARVNARAAVDAETGIEDAMVLQWETASGALGSLDCGYLLREGKDTTLRVQGAEGRCATSLIAGPAYSEETRLLLERADGGPAPRRTITYEHDPVPGYLGRVGRAFVAQFLDACRGEATTPAGIDDALRVLRVMDAAYESADSGEWVTVGD